MCQCVFHFIVYIIYLHIKGLISLTQLFSIICHQTGLCFYIKYNQQKYDGKKYNCAIAHTRNQPNPPPIYK